MQINMDNLQAAVPGNGSPRLLAGPGVHSEAVHHGHGNDQPIVPNSGIPWAVAETVGGEETRMAAAAEAIRAGVPLADLVKSGDAPHALGRAVGSLAPRPLDWAVVMGAAIAAGEAAAGQGAAHKPLVDALAEAYGVGLDAAEGAILEAVEWARVAGTSRKTLERFAFHAMPMPLLEWDKPVQAAVTRRWLAVVDLDHAIAAAVARPDPSLTPRPHAALAAEATASGILARIAAGGTVSVEEATGVSALLASQGARPAAVALAIEGIGVPPADRKAVARVLEAVGLTPAIAAAIQRPIGHGHLLDLDLLGQESLADLRGATLDIKLDGRVRRAVTFTSDIVLELAPLLSCNRPVLHSPSAREAADWLMRNVANAPEGASGFSIEDEITAAEWRVNISPLGGYESDSEARARFRAKLSDPKGVPVGDGKASLEVSFPKNAWSKEGGTPIRVSVVREGAPSVGPEGLGIQRDLAEAIVEAASPHVVLDHGRGNPTYALEALRSSLEEAIALGGGAEGPYCHVRLRGFDPSIVLVDGDHIYPGVREVRPFPSAHPAPPRGIRGSSVIPDRWVSLEVGTGATPAEVADAIIQGLIAEGEA
jgi:sulfur carrier protein ThiS